MILKVKTLLVILLYSSVTLLLIAPFLSNFLGAPRLDTLMMPLLSMMVVAYMAVYKLDRKVKNTTIILLAFSLTGFLSLVLNYSYEGLLDIFYISFLTFLFYTSFAYIQYVNFNNDAAKHLLSFILLIIYLGFFIELLFGIQLVSGNVSLSILDNAFKGFFYNTNDQAVILTSLCGAISFFFILDNKNKKDRYIGYLHLLISGLIIFVSASRTALLAYFLIVLTVLFIKSNKFLKFIYIILAIAIPILLSNLNLLISFLRFLSQFSWLQRSVERFELAIFSLDSDNSVSYRTEIYQRFLDNFSLVWLGYGPRNYYEYFAPKPLSYSLGYTNPHSFFIEAYLAFGIFGFLIFITFLIHSIYIVSIKSYFSKSQKIYFLIIVIIFCILVWVPSSIFRLPLIWYPIFLIIIYSKKPSIYWNKHA